MLAHEDCQVNKVNGWDLKRFGVRGRCLPLSPKQEREWDAISKRPNGDKLIN